MNNLIRFNISAKIGTGHLYRSLNLSETLNNDTYFLIKKNPLLSKYKSLIPAGRFFVFTKNEIEKIKTLVKKYRISKIILDIKDTQKKYISELKKMGIKIISIEDTGSGGKYSDILIDANIPSELAKNNNQLFGHDFVILNKIFSKFNRKNKKLRKSLKKIFLFFGGTDPGGLTDKITKMIDKKRYQIITVQGKDRNTQIPPKQIAELLFDIDAAVISSGLIMFESVCCGTPSIIIDQSKEQTKNSILLEKTKSIIRAGESRLLEKNKFKKILNRLESYDLREKISMTAKKTIDGNGIFRITEIINNL